MTKLALFVRLEAKIGQEAALAEFLASALPLANAESGTTAWFALKFGPSTFGIFDAFANEADREAHLNGAIAAALMANATTQHFALKRDGEFWQSISFQCVDVITSALKMKSSMTSNNRKTEPIPGCDIPFLNETTMKNMLTLAALTLAAASVAQAAPSSKSTAALLAADKSCNGLPTHAEFKEALQAAQKKNNAGLGLNMWGAVVNRAGVVCAVAFTGDTWGDQWPASRIIAAQKASTSNNFSLPKLAMSTANLYSIAQPGGFAFGIQEANPVEPERVYAGPSAYWGQVNDPMVGERVGG